MLVNPEAPRRLEDGVYQHLVVSLDAVLGAARTFFETGKRDAGFTWEKGRSPEPY